MPAIDPNRTEPLECAACRRKRDPDKFYAYWHNGKLWAWSSCKECVLDQRLRDRQKVRKAKALKKPLPKGELRCVDCLKPFPKETFPIRSRSCSSCYARRAHRRYRKRAHILSAQYRLKKSRDQVSAVNTSARVHGVPGFLTQEDWLDKQGPCMNCGSEEDILLDFKVPWAQGGTNAKENIQAKCLVCIKIEALLPGISLLEWAKTVVKRLKG